MRTFSHYFSWLLGVIDTSGIVRDRVSLTRQRVKKLEGYVMSPHKGGFAKPGAPPSGLIFIDGAFLRFQEHVVIHRNGIVEHVSYTYHYQRPDGYYFRYDKREHPFDDPVKRILEPQQHIQVSHPAPRFPTHSTNLRELLTLIKYNFYA